MSGRHCELYHWLPQQSLRSRSGSGSRSHGGNYAATPSSSFEQVVASIAAGIARVGGQAEGGTQTAIEACGSARVPSTGSGFRLRTHQETPQPCDLPHLYRKLPKMVAMIPPLTQLSSSP